MCIHVNTTPNPSDATIGQWVATLGLTVDGGKTFLDALSVQGIGSDDAPEKLDGINFGTLLRAIEKTVVPDDLKALQYAFDDIEEARGNGEPPEYFKTTVGPATARPHGSSGGSGKKKKGGAIVGAVIGLMVMGGVIFGVFKLKGGGQTAMYTLSVENEDFDGEADDDILLGE
jgi:hypothetical protein